MQEYETMLGVALCDFGYCAKVSKVMTLPDGYCTLPELSVRCDISEFVESKANLWDNYFKVYNLLRFLKLVIIMKSINVTLELIFQTFF